MCLNMEGGEEMKKRTKSTDCRLADSGGEGYKKRRKDWQSGR